MDTEQIVDAEIIEEEGRTESNTNETRAASQNAQYPEGWSSATKTLWNGAIFTGVLVLLCAILIFFFPKEGMANPMKIGLGTLLVYFLVLTLTALGAINTYQKGLTQFASMFSKDGARALDVIRWGFMMAMMGVLFHFFIFYLPITDIDTKRQTSTLLLGNSIIILSALCSVVGFLMLATAKGCPDASRKGCLLMLGSLAILLVGAFIAPSAIFGTTLLRIVEFVILLTGSILFLVAWHKIVHIKL